MFDPDLGHTYRSGVVESDKLQISVCRHWLAHSARVMRHTSGFATWSIPARLRMCVRTTPFHRSTSALVGPLLSAKGFTSSKSCRSPRSVFFPSEFFGHIWL